MSVLDYVPIYFFVDRSHAIFTVWIKVIYTDPGGHKHYRKGKLNLVDLAGSERHGKTGNKSISSAVCLQFTNLEYLQNTGTKM